MIRSLSLLKRNAFAAPFERAFAEQKKLEVTSAPTDGSPRPQGDLMEIHYRDEAIYVRASHDRVTVIFSTMFKEETDRIFGKVFLQEFVDARRQAALQNAPQVLYSSRDPPLEIRHLRGLRSSEDVGYVTFGEIGVCVSLHAILMWSLQFSSLVTSPMRRRKILSPESNSSVTISITTSNVPKLICTVA